VQGTIQNYTLDMADGYKKEPLQVKQHDTNSRWAKISLKAFGQPWKIPGESLCYISVKKADNTVVQNDCTIEEDGTVLAPISGQIATVAGIQQAELYFLAEDGDIKSQTFPIQVLPAILDSNIAESSDEFGALQSALLNVQTATAAAAEATTKAETQAQNAGAAAELAIDAAASIDRAVQAAAEAKTSETNARASETAAAQTKADVEALKEGFIGYDKTESGRKYANALTTTAEGEGQVAVTDAWDAPVVDMEIDGASEQVTMTGAQLLDIKLPSVTTKSGVTVSIADDGGIRLNGTATASGNHRLIDPVKNLSINCDSATLSLQASGAYDGTVMVSDAADGEWKSLLSVKNNATATGTVKTSKLGCYATYVAGTTYNVTLYPMLCASPTALPWEPYTGGQPSPSPEYPQEIKGVEHVVNSGAQLFDASRIPTKTAGGATVTNNGDGSFTISGSGTATAVFNDTVYYSAEEAAKLFVKPGKYTLSGGISTPYIALTMAENDVLLIDVALPIKDSVSFTVTEDMIEKIKSGAIKVKSGFFSQPDRQLFPGTVKPMLNYGDALPWEPYNNQQREIDLQIESAGKNLFNKNALYSYNVNGVTITQLGSTSVRISTVSARTFAAAAVKLKLKPYTTYTFSGDITALTTKSMIGVRKSTDGGVSFVPDMIVAFATEVPANGVSRTFTTDENEYYALCLLCTNDVEATGTTTFENIQLEEGSKATAWESYYEPQSVSLPLAEPLHGIGDVRDRIACKDGVWGIERLTEEIVFNGSEKWELNLKPNNKMRYKLRDATIMPFDINVNACVMCDAYISRTAVETHAGKQGIAVDDVPNILIYDEAVSDENTIDRFKAQLQTNPINAIFQSKSPVWEPFPAETQTALNALTTHPGTTYLTVASTDVAAPVRLTYVQDTRKVVDGLKLDLAEQMTELQAQIDQLKVTNNLA
jgi:hypothetical protein